MRNVKQYYKELGRVVYAIATVDGFVQDEEKDKLHSFVATKLAPNEPTHDSSGMNQAFYVDFEFEENIEKHPDMSGAVKSYKDFIEQNAEAGDEALLQRSVRLIEAVIFAYSKRKEKLMLDQVKNITSHVSALKIG